MMDANKKMWHLHQLEDPCLTNSNFSKFFVKLYLLVNGQVLILTNMYLLLVGL